MTRPTRSPQGLPRPNANRPACSAAGLAACLSVAVVAFCAAARAASSDQSPIALTSLADGRSGGQAKAEGGRLSPLELQVWNDPAFQKRFAESYIAETEIEPTVTADEREQMMKVLKLISDDRLDEAAKQIEKQRDDSASAVFDFTLANICFQQEKLDQAAAAYQAAVDKYPKFLRAWRNLALVHVRRGELDKALPALTRVVELGGADALTFGLLGYADSSAGDDLAAESAYRMAILLDPRTLDWKTGLARSLFRQERYAEAAALCGRLIADQPARADLWLLQANAYIGLNQPVKAAENYEFVDCLGKSTRDSLNMLGDIYVNEGLFSMAVESYVRALDRDPQPDPARATQAAKVMAARGAFEDTGRLIEQIETRCGDRLETKDRKELLKLRARLAVAAGAGGEEAATLEEIVRLDPLDGEALMLLGQHESRSGNTEKAALYYERAAAINEKFEADAKVRLAQLLVGQGKYAEALPLLRRAQTVNPRDNVQQYLDQVERLSKSR